MSHSNSRAFCLALLLLTCALALRNAAAQDPQVRLTPFAMAGLAQPLDITHAGDGSGRLFVIEKTGRIKIVDGASGTVTGTFLDLGGQVSTNSERGLLGLAFAPDYAASGRFYVYYSDLAGDSRVSRFRVSATNANLADPSSEEVLLTIPQPYSNHNGGDVAFGGDGLLYVASGDGGSSNDPQGNSQDPTNLLGAILRLDVGGASGYVPAGGGPATWDPHVYAIGLRNPWRMSFDAGTGLLWVGDVGQGAREEIDVLVPAASGQNFGWVCWEGTRDNRGVPSATGCGGIASYLLPFFEYDHGLGQSVTGGEVYRGAQYPSLQGFYVFADYRSDRMWALRDNGSAALEVYDYPDAGDRIVGFGTDEAGELYAVSLFSGVYRVEAAAAAPLPVELSRVSATPTGAASVRVEWHVTGEVDVERYEVEHYAPAGARDRRVDFGAIGAVAATGKEAYGFDVGGLAAGEHLFRLRTRDLDGTAATSRAVSVTLGAGGHGGSEHRLGVVVEGRRARVLHGARTLAQVTPLHVVDAAGRTVYAGTPAEAGVLDLAGWPAGTYSVRVGEGPRAPTLRFVKP